MTNDDHIRRVVGPRSTINILDAVRAVQASHDKWCDVLEKYVHQTCLVDAPRPQFEIRLDTGRNAGVYHPGAHRGIGQIPTQDRGRLVYIDALPRR